MKFEDILHEVGDSGLYQRLLVFGFCLPCCLVIPWYSMANIFLASTPEHWCYVPEVAHSNLSLKVQRSLISPPKHSSCLRYDVNYSQILISQNWTVNPSSPTISCDKGWQYEKKHYEATAVTKWDMVCKNDHYSSLFLSTTFIGITLGTPITGYMSDKLGRKPTFFIMVLIIAITEISSCVSPFLWLLFVLRFINGTTITTLFSSMFIILLEVMSPTLRARVNGISSASWSLGMCILSVIAWSTRNFIYLSGIISTSAGCILLYWYFLPESPRWLISQGRYEEATEIMAKISRINSKGVHHGNYLQERIRLGTFDEIVLTNAILFHADVAETRYTGRVQCHSIGVVWCGEGCASSGAPHHLTMVLNYEELSPDVSYGSSQTIANNPLCRFSAMVCSCLPYYGHQANARNLSANEFKCYFYMAMVELPANAITWWLMQNIGRKASSFIAFTVSAIASIVPAVVAPDFKTVAMIAALFAKGGSTACFMSVYQQAPELFPTPLRATGVGLCSAIGTGFSFFAPYVVYLAKYSISLPFIIFAIMAVIGLVCGLFLPETLNEILPQTILEAENFGLDQKIFQCRIKKSVAEYPEPEPQLSFGTSYTSDPLFEPVHLVCMQRKISTSPMGFPLPVEGTCSSSASSKC